MKNKKTGLPFKGKPVEYFKKYNMASPLSEESVAPPKPYWFKCCQFFNFNIAKKIKFYKYNNVFPILFWAFKVASFVIFPIGIFKYNIN